MFASRTVVDLVGGSQLEFSEPAPELKGVPEAWQLFARREPTDQVAPGRASGA